MIGGHEDRREWDKGRERGGSEPLSGGLSVCLSVRLRVGTYMPADLYLITRGSRTAKGKMLQAPGSTSPAVADDQRRVEGRPTAGGRETNDGCRVTDTAPQAPGLSVCGLRPNHRPYPEPTMPPIGTSFWTASLLSLSPAP